MKIILLIFINALFFMNVHGATIILTSDQQLRDLLDPDKKIDLSTGFTKRFASLREICEAAQRRGDKVLTIAFDEFFRQYRQQAATERLLTPDMDEYIDKIKVIADFAEQYGLGMGLSLLSPLELGPAFKNKTGENGTWLHYKVGLRDPETGKFYVPLWQQLVWSNNKGNFSLRLKSYKAYAFKEKHLHHTPFKVVDRNDILPLQQVGFDEWSLGQRVVDETNTDTYSWDAAGDEDIQYERVKRVAVYSDGSEELKGYDRVMVLLEYEVPEMEYFSHQALPFLKDLLDKYNDKGIHIQHFYSDEMHIQQDWLYFNHHDNGQLALRYYSPAMGDMYQDIHGVPFEEKDILYFAYGPGIDSKSALAAQNVQYVFGESREDIHKTFLFRDRYYKLLNNHVVDLFKDAKEYAGEIFGVDDFGTFGHASWAESPTVDLWEVGDLNPHAYKYEYTPNYIWGNTVQQAAAACYDYFKWGEYLEPTRNDFAELGWNDRNYYGAAMSASIGVINRFPHSYPAFWGMPDKVAERKAAINDAFGGRIISKSLEMIIGKVHRDVDVLILYPMNLVAAEERYGSWVTQYGYANFITAEKLLELGVVNDNGEIEILEKKYSSLVTLFEPLPQKGLLDLMSELLSKGGNVFWFGMPPVIDGEGKNCQAQWQSIFGVKHESNIPLGQIAAGKKIDFTNQLDQVPHQYILTDFIVDHIYPVTAEEGTLTMAFCDEQLVGTGKGRAYYFGFRPRDDQSASLGYETRTLFEILDKLGAHPASGKFAGVNDNTEHVSRTSEYLTTRFPNGAIAIVRHYKNHRESWDGNFSRNQAQDQMVLELNPLPPAEIDISNFMVNGHRVSYNGRLSMAFRMNEANELIAFEGQNCNQVEIDGKLFKFSDSPLQKIAFTPSPDSDKNEMLILVNGSSSAAIPISKSISSNKIKLLDSEGQEVPFRIRKNAIHITIDNELSNKWLTMLWE